MSLDFPANPVDNQEFGDYVYDATKGVWNLNLSSPAYLPDHRHDTSIDGDGFIIEIVTQS